MSLNRRITCYNKAVGITVREKVALCIRPFHKMITDVRSRRYFCRRALLITVRIRLYRTVSVRKQINPQGINCKMRHDRPVVNRTEPVRIVGGKKRPANRCPFLKMIMRIRKSLRLYLFIKLVVTAHNFYPPICSGRETDIKIVLSKIGIKRNIPCNIKCIRIACRNSAVVCFIRPSQKAVTFFGACLYLYRCPVRIGAVTRHYPTVQSGKQTHIINRFGYDKMRLNSRLFFNSKRIGITCRNSIAVCIRPLLKIVTRVRRCPCLYLCVIIMIRIARIFYPPVFSGRQTYFIAVWRKMRLKSRIAFYDKAVGITNRKTVTHCIRPLQKMIPHIGSSRYVYQSVIFITAVARCYRTVVGRQTYLMLICNKVGCHLVIYYCRKRIGIIYRKKLTPCTCPFLKVKTRIWESLYRYVRPVFEAVLPAADNRISYS
ncbi:hypothetical protein Barb7_02814 [Bacteroidales bacterium Barb7]|nr:hypothetical protein Barb7_02814 [Bacteroidales bacterium Barb7]